ncbi:MAG: FAD-binding protein [Betaproteobacteria bacterium]|nr:FAD-binding protein [Betaproteobacteria bacterium]
MRADPYDLVVVGHGAAGLAAALAAAESAHGARIAVLERAPHAESGGGSRWSPSNMRMKSVSELAPDFEQDMVRACGERTDRAYFRRLAAEAPSTLAWLEGHGVKFHTPGYYLSAGPPRIQAVGGGAAILEAMERAAKATGVEFHYECPATRLLTGAGGAVEGGEAISAGTARTFATHAVVLASGGFEGNAEMLREQFGPGGASLRPISPGSVYNRGEGIRMALDAGAQRAGDWNGMHAEPVDARSRQSAPVVLVYPYGIVVDRDGKRFFDEGAGLVHETWEHVARAIHFSAPGRVAWAILDARMFDISGYERAIRSELPPLRADSIATLAALAGISPEGIERSVAEYNASCTGDPARFDATRADALSAAPGLVPPKSNWARAIERPPFLAYPLVGAIAYTFGGIATNESAEVLGAAGPIPGLYAAGEITGHFHGTAPNAVAMMRALVFGRIAGAGSMKRQTR